MLKSIFIFYLCIVVCIATAIANDNWTLYFDSSNVDLLEMGSSTEIKFYAQTNTSWGDKNLKVQLTSSDEDVAYTNHHLFNFSQTDIQSWNFSVNLTTEFLGYTQLFLRVVELSKSITKLVYKVYLSYDLKMKLCYRK